jgi:hypothetical protein
VSPVFDELLALLDSPSRDPIRLAEPRQGGRIWSFCPVHGDGTKYGRRSLSLHPTYGVTCFAGCTFLDIVRALRERAGLHPAHAPATQTVPRRIEAGRGQLGLRVASWPYHDEEGRALYRVVRFEGSAGKTYRQQRVEGGGTCCDAEPRRCKPDRESLGWAWGHGEDVAHVLYRLPEAIDAGDRPIFIVEGEKAADALRALGLVATCNSGGAGKWRGELSWDLKNRRAVILPDNDHPGAAHAEDVGGQLLDVGAEVRFVVLPGLPFKGDVVDWLAAGGTREALLSFTERAPVARQPSKMFPLAVDVRVLASGGEPA